MSWSRSLVIDNLKEGVNDMISLANQDKKIQESVLFDYNDYFLFEEEMSPYLIIGKDLKTQLGDFVEIDANLYQVVSYDYEDDIYQVFNLKCIAKFKSGVDTVEMSTGKKYTILEVLTHCYKIQNDVDGEGFVPLHMQNKLQLE